MKTGSFSKVGLVLLLLATMFLTACGNITTTPVPNITTGTLMVTPPTPNVLKFVSKFTGEPDKITTPTDIARDEQNNLYVTDAATNRVVKLDENGKLVLAWGSKGNGDGQFLFKLNSGEPAPIISALGVDRLNNWVYVIDGNHRLQKFDTSGKFLAKWGDAGNGDGQFQSAWALMADGASNVFVADTINNRIQKFDSNGKLLGKWGSMGRGEGQFNRPGGVTVDGQGFVYVSDNGNYRIQKFDNNGQFVTQWGSIGSGAGQFNQPTGVEADNQGYIYVSDTGNHRIQKFDSTGKYVAEWGSAGKGDSQFQLPWGLVLDGRGYVYVSDTGNQRIQKFLQS